MTATNWTITSIKCYPEAQGETDVVFQICWLCEALAVQNGNQCSARRAGCVDVTYTSGQPFTPYNQLTQQQVLDWVWAGVNKNEMEAEVLVDLQGQLTPVVVSTPLPWQPSKP